MPVDLSIVKSFLSGVTELPQDAEFIQNVKDEAFKALAEGQVQTVSRHDKTLTITIKMP